MCGVVQSCSAVGPANRPYCRTMWHLEIRTLNIRFNLYCLPGMHYVEKYLRTMITIYKRCLAWKCETEGL